MKKLLCLLALLLCAVTFAAAEDEVFTSGDWQYTVLKDGTAEIKKYRGKDQTLTIPEKLDGYTVSAIGKSSFAECRALTSVVIPDSVTVIGDKAFYWCPALESITLPKGLTTIGDKAFDGCSHLPSITLPISVTSIGVNPFMRCDALTAIHVAPEHPTLAVIDGVLFSKPDKRLVCYPRAFEQESYAIPQGIEIIGDYAFFFCRFLRSVTIPDGVIAIGEAAFCGCDALTNVTIPASVTFIGGDAFYNCPNLTLTLVRSSWAAAWARENGIPYTYTYPDANDWLAN